MAAPRDEQVEVVDEDGRVVGLASRAAVRAGNLRHRSVGVVVVTGARELVAHRPGHTSLWSARRWATTSPAAVLTTT